MIKNCKYCNKEFETVNKNKIYCSTNCKSYYNQKNKDVEYLKNCKNCNKEFNTNSELKVFCDDNCRKSYFIKNPKKHEYNLICANCGKPFSKILANNPNLKGENHYCSQECVALHKNKVGIGEKYICKQCGKEFDQIHKRHFFCTLECKRIYNTINGPKKIVNCSYCQKEIERPRSLKQLNFFCSVECESSFRIEEANDIRFCESCGKEFICKKSEKLRFCSYECQGVWQSKFRIGKNHPCYNFDVSDEERIKNCEICGKEIIRKPYEIKADSVKYCSRACAVLGMNKSLTTPHIKVSEFLYSIDYNIKNEFSIGRYSADIYLIDTNLLFEINGTYWHSDIRFYPIPEREAREIGIAKEKRKNKKLLDKGYKILYLWEYDINNNFEICKKLILEYIKNNGILNNYHSMNYHLDNEELKLNLDILIPHADI